MIVTLKTKDKYEILRRNTDHELYWAPYTCIWSKELVIESHKEEYLYGFMVVNTTRHTIRIKKQDFSKETSTYLNTKGAIYASKLPII